MRLQQFFRKLTHLKYCFDFLSKIYVERNVVKHNGCLSSGLLSNITLICLLVVLALSGSDSKLELDDDAPLCSESFPITILSLLIGNVY